MHIYTDSQGLYGSTVWSSNLSDLLLYLSRRMRRVLREQKGPVFTLGKAQHDPALQQLLNDHAALYDRQERALFKTASSVTLQSLTSVQLISPRLSNDYFLHMRLVVRWEPEEPAMRVLIELYVNEKDDARIRQILNFEDRIRAL